MVITGKSMANTIEIAANLGYIDIPPDTLISIEEAKNLKPEQIVLLMTGSQENTGLFLAG